PDRRAARGPDLGRGARRRAAAEAEGDEGGAAQRGRGRRRGARVDGRPRARPRLEAVGAPHARRGGGGDQERARHGLRDRRGVRQLPWQLPRKSPRNFSQKTGDPSGNRSHSGNSLFPALTEATHTVSTPFGALSEAEAARVAELGTKLETKETTTAPPRNFVN